MEGMEWKKNWKMEKTQKMKCSECNSINNSNTQINKNDVEMKHLQKLTAPDLQGNIIPAFLDKDWPSWKFSTRNIVFAANSTYLCILSNSFWFISI